MGAWNVGDHSLTGQRMAPHTPEESPQVKTRCFRVGSIRLYAPMVPLAPHPCVRWWNTKMMPLKLTRLGLHSLKCGSSHQKPSHPVGAGSVWVVGAWEAYGCVDVGDHSLTGQRMAPHPPKKALRSRPSVLESARHVFTLPWSLLPRTRASVRGTLKKSR